jgi:hypothetical protein
LFKKGDKDMLSNNQTTVIEADKLMNTNSQTAAIKERKMQPTASNLIRWSGLAAMGAGIIFSAIQPIHPADVVSSVTTPEWAIITSFKTAACLLFLLGIAGIYARQVKKTGWLGLAGFLLLSLSWSIQLAFVFAEAYIFPPLAAVAPQFVDSVLAVPSGRPVEMDLGAVPALYGLLVGGSYMLGGLLFGLATLRAGILPRLAGGLLAVAAALTPLAALFPHNIQRFAALPVGLALAWLGYSLWSERRAHSSEPLPGAAEEAHLLGQTAAE